MRKVVFVRNCVVTFVCFAAFPGLPLSHFAGPVVIPLCGMFGPLIMYLVYAK